MNKGKLIVIEDACDGIGKSTQYNLLYDRLTNENNLIYKHHFPSYNTYQGVPVEKYLDGEFGSPKDISPYFINSLYATDRAVTWYKDLKLKYDNNYIILLDRYTTSSLIYQSALIEDLDKKKEFIDYVCDFEYKKLGIKEPDQVIFLHAPFNLVTNMRNSRKENDGIANDIHESDLEFMKHVYDSGMFVADYLEWNMIDCSKDNSLKSVEEIHEEIYRLVKRK